MRLLLDEHIAEAVAAQLRSLGLDVATVARWHDGALRERPDHELLAAALPAERVLVTYDVDTVPTTAMALLDDGAAHAGVLLISHRTIRQNEVGALVRSLHAFLATHGDENWTNRVGFLPRA